MKPYWERQEAIEELETEVKELREKNEELEGRICELEEKCDGFDIETRQLWESINSVWRNKEKKEKYEKN